MLAVPSLFPLQDWPPLPCSELSFLQTERMNLFPALCPACPGDLSIPTCQAPVSVSVQSGNQSHTGL